MKALVLEKYNKFTWKEVPEPDYGPCEVLIQVKACAVCGSDVHGMDGSTGRRIPPVIMGHEAAGVIAACGEEVRAYQVGDRVTFDSTIYCGLCEDCRAGHVNLCEHRRVLGVSCADYRRNGAFAEYVAVPEHVLYRLPEQVSFRQACMVEPMAVAYHAVTRTVVPQKESAVIFGVGTIGIFILQILRAMGACHVIAVDLSAERLLLAEKNGAASAINARDDGLCEKILQMTPAAQGALVCYDATGTDLTMNNGLRVLKKGGSLVLIGNLDAKTQLPLQWVVTRQLSLFGSCASAGEYGPCLALIASGAVTVDELISKVAPMAEGNEWIHRVYQREPGLTKIILEP